MYAWMRRLEVTLTSRKMKKKLVFGQNYLRGEDDLSINVHGYKYLSTLKDECTIKISNLTYAEITLIQQGEFYDVTVTAGYRSASANDIFKGGVLYISTFTESNKTLTAIILCASQLVARFGQKRMNLTLNSNINMYAAIKFACKYAGIPDNQIDVSTQLKKKFLPDLTNIDSTPASFIEQLCKVNDSYMPNSDAINGGVVSLYDAARSNKRIIYLRNDNIILNEYPHLTEEGLDITVMPTFNFMCGDTVKIDNSLIEIPVYNKTDMSKNYGYFMDKDGFYIVYQMEYTLANRASQFELKMLCKARSLISRLAGTV